VNVINEYKDMNKRNFFKKTIYNLINLIKRIKTKLIIEENKEIKKKFNTQIIIKEIKSFYIKI